MKNIACWALTHLIGCSICICGTPFQGSHWLSPYETVAVWQFFTGVQIELTLGDYFI